MKKSMHLLALVIVIIFLLTNKVYAEAFMDWDEITIKSNDLNVPLRINIIAHKNKISSIDVQIDNSIILVPKDSLKDTKRPNLDTTTIGYWNSERLDFYIAIKCGVIGSFPHKPIPKVVFFIFNNGNYSHNESYSILNSPNFSLELYQMINRKNKKK